MKKAILVVSLGAAALVLQGCGGGGDGGGGDPTSCIDPTIDLVSQSVTGTMTGTMKGTMHGQAVSATINMPMTEKIDLDEFNLRQDVTGATIQLNGLGTPFTLDVKSIVNVAEKTTVVWYKMEGGPKAMQNCSKITSDKIPDPAVIAAAFKNLVMPQLKEAATCGGNDGTLDTWNLNVDTSKLPIPPGVKVPGTATIDAVIKMDKDHLINDMTYKVSVNVDAEKIGKQHMDIDMDMKFSSSSAGGPQASDLDYSSWGTCYDTTPPGKEASEMKLFHAQDSSEVSVILEKIINEGFFQKILLASMQAKPEAHKKEAVVV